MRCMIPFALLAILAGCSQEPASEARVVKEDLTTFDVKEESAADAAAVAPAAEGGAVPAAAPRIAYKYSFGYRLAGDDIGPVQKAHMALCEKMGTAKCRIVSMQRQAQEGDFLAASLNLQVEASQARAFGDSLDKAVGDAGGDVSNRGIEAEDLSKQMVDTEARIKAKQALADRLLVLLSNRNGKVGELVEAERAFAQAQEELDAARSWMAEMQQRVALSEMRIDYSSDAPTGSGLWRPIRDSLASAGQMLGNSLGGLISFVAIIIPWVLAIFGIGWLLRRLGVVQQWRFPWPKRWRRTADVETA